MNENFDWATYAVCWPNTPDGGPDVCLPPHCPDSLHCQHRDREFCSRFILYYGDADQIVHDESKL